jgi:hypothetical protein
VEVVKRLALTVLVAMLLAPVVSAQLTGPQPMLVMPVNAFNRPTETYTMQELADAFAPGSPLNTFYIAVSSGTVNGFAALLRPWVTRSAMELPVVDFSACDGTLPRDRFLLQNTATSAATAAGVPVNAYSRQLFLMPDFGCAANGIQDGGSLTIAGRTPPSIWAHELLHSYGAGHPSIERCDTSGCQSGYGAFGAWMDPYDIMANAYSWELPGVFERLYLSYRSVLTGNPPWLDSSRAPVVTPGTYTILPVTSLAGQIAVRVPGPADQYGNREEIGVELRTDGVVIRRAFNQGGYMRNFTLLDMDRVSSEFRPILSPGQTYTWNGHTVTPVSVTTLSASILIDGGGPTSQPPQPCLNLRAV